MLKLIIVEDEELDRNGLKRNVNWHDMGIEVTGVYKNGQDAFNTISNSTLDRIPDIILTDIRMPLMDGLTLAKKVNELYKNIKIVFISGYDDFNYAKKAIELSASRYILKPFEIQEFTDIITEIADQCNEEKRKLLEERIMEQKLNESLPLLKEKFCIDLLQGIHKGEDEIRKRIKFLNLPLCTEGKYIVNLVEIDNYNDLIKGKEDNFVNALPLFIIDGIQGNLTRKQGICINKRESVFAIIQSYNRNGSIKEKSCPCNKEGDIRESDSFYDKGVDIEEKNYHSMENIQMYINKFFKTNATIGISRIHHNLKGIGIANIEAEKALEFKFFVGNNQIINIRDTLDKGSNSGTIRLDQSMKAAIGRLMPMLTVGDKEAGEKQINTIFKDMLESKSDKGYIQSICIDIINNISKSYLNTGSETGNIFRENLKLINDLLELDTVFDIQKWISKIIISFATCNYQRNNSRNQRIVRQIKDAVNKRFAEDLSVSLIASEVFLSAGYATSLFKKETGISIMDYIIKVRIETAKKMLQDPNSRINEVSYGIGYENISYFSSLFKNCVGMTPKEYRDCYTESLLSDILE